MGPPVIQSAPAVPKMGVRARMSDWSQRGDIWDAQLPPRYDSLVPSFLNRPPDSDRLLEKILDLQTGSETRFPLCDLLGSSTRRSLVRMKRSNSEVTISDAGAEDLDPAAVDPNTGAGLRREYGSTSDLDQQLPKPPLLHTSLSPSLQAAAHIAQGDVFYVPGHDHADASGHSRDEEPSCAQKTKSEKTSIFSRLRSPRTDGSYVQQDGGLALTPHRFFSHYDVQSVLFDISEAFDPRAGRKNAPAGTSEASHHSDAAARTADFDVPSVECDEAFGDDRDGKSSRLVLSCPFFRNEIGGETERKLGLSRAHGTTCSCSEAPLSCTNAGVSVLEACTETRVFPQNLMKNDDVEHIDRGAKYYLKYFYGRDHQNYFGLDKNFGPVSLSVRREKLEDGKEETQYNYRVILRTSQLSTLRGSILEDSVPSSSKHGTRRGLPLRDVLEFVVPELNIQSLRRATSSPRVPELLLQLDQKELNFQLKVGVLFCRASQNTEDHMYNNKTSSPALDQFLDLLGHKVPLKGFTKYRGQLDTTGDSTGSHSVYTTFREFELMFHVSTPLRFTANDPQQLLFKHHIGNNIVTVIFQEPDAPPFSPQNICSHFQHVFIIVRVHRPCSQHTCYSVAMSRCRDVPSFGPLIPPGRMFPASPAFRDFLLMKIINAEHAARRSQTFVAMATRSRQEHLKELVETFITSTPVDSVRFSFISLGGRKKERSVPRPHAHLQSSGALTWRVTARHASCDAAVTCRLAISNERVVLIEEVSRQVVFNCYCRDVIGWSAEDGGIKVFHQHGDCVMFSIWDGRWEEVREITQRLQLLTRGGPAVAVSLRRNRLGQLGFHVNFEGVVADVEAHGFAWQAGLRPGCRLVEICTVALVTLTHEQMIELLRRSAVVSVVVIPPHRDGTPRRSFSEMYRVPMVDYKVDSDVTVCPFRVAPPTWHQVSAAPPNQRAGCESKQQLSLLNQSCSTDVTEGSRALPDWLLSSDENILGRSRRSRSEGATDLHHPPHGTKVLREFQLSDTQQRFAGESCSSTLSSSSSKGRRSERCLTCTKGASTDSGIGSTPCTSSAPPPAAGGTLVLRDVWEEDWTRESDLTTSASHVTDQNKTCSLPSDSRGSRNSSSGRLMISSSADSPEALITCAGGSAPEVWSTDSQETCPQEGEGLNTSDGGSLLDEANSFSGCPIRGDFIRMTRCDITAGVEPLSSVPPPSPWRHSLYRTLSLTGSRSSPLMSDQPLPQSISRRRPTLQRRLCYSESSLAETSNRAECGQMPLPLMSSSLEDVEQTSKAAGVFSSSSLSAVDQLHHTLDMTSQSAALQDSDITASSLLGKVFWLEEILRQLQLDLLKEQQDKAALQQEVLNLRQDNLRLQAESRSAGERIRKFTTCMLHRGALP